MTAQRSDRPLVNQLGELMEKRGLSMNRLSAMVGVSQSHLSRILGQVDNKTVSGELAERIAVALGLPPDWFPETRQAKLFEAIRADDVLRDRLYDELVR